MFKKLLKISLAAVVIGAGIFFAKDKLVWGKYSYMQTLARGAEDEDEGSAMNAMSDFFNTRRANPATGVIDQNAIMSAYQSSSAKAMNKSGNGSLLNWTEMGPDNIGGRCRAILIDKDSNNVIYAGSVTGGLFKSNDAGSTWKKVCNNPVENQGICSITQSADGTIYYGTGENDFMFGGSIKAYNFSAPGFYGRGIYKSTDHGNTFKLLASTDPVSKGSSWLDVSTMASDPTDPNRIYAGNDNSFMISTDAGVTWKPAGGAVTGYQCKDIKMTKNGKTIYIVMGKGGGLHYIFKSTDQGNNFVRIATKTGAAVPGASDGIALAIAPTNESIIYASVAASDGTFDGVYRSEDGGDNWASLARGDAGHIFNPFAAQGAYDNAIAVDPLNSDKVYVAGLNLFSILKTGSSAQTTQLTDWSWNVGLGGFVNSHYVHADQHTIIFDHGKPYPSVYIATDGGVSKSSNIADPNTAVPTFNNADFGLNATQFYGIGVGADDPANVIGGAQDNGTITVKKTGITLLNGEEVHGGDGGYCEISKLNPQVYFAEYTQGDMFRSFNQGKSWSPYFDDHITPKGPAYSFISWFSLWESANDPTSIDSVTFVDPLDAHKKGETIVIHSSNGIDFPFVLKSDLPANEQVKVIDPTQSKLFVVCNNEVWMTREILNKSLSKPTFFRIALISGFKPLMIRATPDGNTAFVVGLDGSGASIYRITGLSGKKYAYSGANTFNPANIGITTTRLFSSSGQIGTGVAIDENNPDHILFTTGTFDAQNGHIFACNNALDSLNSPVFTNIGGGLPAGLPIFDALIDSHNPKMYLAATDLGVYSSTNSGASWQEENNGMERVPTVMLRQMKYSSKPWNGPYIFACTFGRGVFYSSTLTSGIDNNNGYAAADKLKVSIYPNPARSFTNISVILPASSGVSVTLYDMQGRLAGTYNFNRQLQGDHVFNIETANLRQGTYFVKVQAGAFEQTSKMLILND